ncbi:Hypothetical protein A7982_04343 [Minicystis rosea]|nr:Hypothetical protein A7982_04343 [Minicystis rosea]
MLGLLINAVFIVGALNRTGEVEMAQQRGITYVDAATKQAALQRDAGRRGGTAPWKESLSTLF